MASVTAHFSEGSLFENPQLRLTNEAWRLNAAAPMIKEQRLSPVFQKDSLFDPPGNVQCTGHSVLGGYAVVIWR